MGLNMFENIIILGIGYNETLEWAFTNSHYLLRPLKYQTNQISFRLIWKL